MTCPSTFQFPRRRAAIGAVAMVLAVGNVGLGSPPYRLRTSVIDKCGTLSLGETWTADNIYVVGCGVIVGDDVTLIIEAGTIVKFTSAGYLHVLGTLETQGTTSSLVVLTSYQDDDHGGDTNGDGSATSPAVGDWPGLLISSDTSSLDNSLIQYSGDGIYVDQLTSPTITHNTIRYNGTGVYVLASASPAIIGNAFIDNSAHLRHSPICSPTYSENTFSGMGGGAIHLTGGVGLLGGETTWQNVQGLNWPYVLGMLDIIGSGTLHLPTGTVLKFRPYGRLRVYGTLDTQGTAAQPNVFTSYMDDSYGGDTNNDGSVTSAAPGDWWGIYLYSGTALDNSVIQYSVDGVSVGGSVSPTVTRNVLRYNDHGITVGDATPSIASNVISGNATYGIYNSGGVPVVAEDNWWGDATGPYHPTLNPSGAGDHVSDNVDFVPWLTAPPNSILVEDEEGTPVGGAEIFRNGVLAGTTATDGTLNIPALTIGDQLVARLRVVEVPSGKDNHNQDSSQNWAYRVHITSLEVPQSGDPLPRIVTDPFSVQVLTIGRSNALIGFNIVVSLEWDADSAYISELLQAFGRASSYLFDASDGQMLLERVTIYDDSLNMPDADYQIRDSNQEWPRANVRGLLSGDNMHVFLGRYFDGKSAAQGSWAAQNGYRTQIHEFGHYGLGLFDSYFYYDDSGRRNDSHCTSAAIRTNNTPAVNATLMDYQYNASEFSVKDVPELWTDQCQNTEQWRRNGESDWATILRYYRDESSPVRWVLKTPADSGGVVEGPGSQPVGAWSTIVIGHDASTGVCETPLPYCVEQASGEPAQGAAVTLRKGNRTIYQGKTDDKGGITVLGAASGDRVVLGLWGNDFQNNSTQVECGALGQSQAALNPPSAIVLHPAAFTLEISTLPGVAANQLKIIIKASTGLSDAPETYVTQSGAASAVFVPLSFDGALQSYMGTTALDPDLLSSGNIVARATDAALQEVEVAAQFALEPIAADQDVTVWSSDGQVELYLPAGSLSGDGRVSIVAGQVLDSLPDGLIVISGPYTLQGDEGLTLVDTANLSLYYLNAGGSLRHVDTSSAQLYRWDGQDWQALPSTSSQVEQMVSAAVNEFGTYVVMAERQEKIYLPLVVR